MVKSLRMTGRAQAARAALQIVETALEKIAIGQDGERRRAARLVLAGEFGGAEIFDQHAFAGGSLLDFGDDGGAFGRAGRRRNRAVRSAPDSAESAQFGSGNRGGAQFFPLAGHNSGQDVGRCGGQISWYRRREFRILYGVAIHLLR